LCILYVYLCFVCMRIGSLGPLPPLATPLSATDDNTDDLLNVGKRKGGGQVRVTSGRVNRSAGHQWACHNDSDGNSWSGLHTTNHPRQRQRLRVTSRPLPRRRLQPPWQSPWQPQLNPTSPIPPLPRLENSFIKTAFSFFLFVRARASGVKIRVSFENALLFYCTSNTDSSDGIAPMLSRVT